MLDCNTTDFNAYRVAFPTGGWHRLLVGRRGGRSVTGVQEVGGMVSPFTTVYCMACKHGFMVYYSWTLEGNYKTNDQPVHERVMASSFSIFSYLR